MQSAVTGKWRRFLANRRAAASAALLAAIMLGSLFGGIPLPPPGEVVDPASLEPYRRVTLRIVPDRRAGRLDISPDMAIVSESGCGAFDAGLTNGAPVTAALPLGPEFDAAVAARFANSPAPPESFPLVLPDGSEAVVSLSEFKPRQSPPRTVRIRLRDSDSPDAGRTVTRSMTRGAFEASGLGGLALPSSARPGDDFSALAAAFGIPAPPAHGTAELALEPVAWPFRPVPGHPLGIDAAGRDVLSRIVAGTRIALLFGMLLVVSSMAAGIAVGAIQGYFGGIADMASQRLIEIWSALPFLYVMMLVGSVLGRSFGLLLLCYGLFNWIGISYYVRAEFLRLRGRPFVEAARCQGFPAWKIMLRHILPNAMTPVVTLLPFSLIGAISSISALDFLGFGLPPLTPSLGELLGQAQSNAAAWWLVAYPASVLFTIMLLAVFIGEGLRDAFDPKPTARYR